MKLTTPVKDLIKLLEGHEAENAAAVAKSYAKAALEKAITGTGPALIDPVTLSRAQHAEAQRVSAVATFAALPKARREEARRVHDIALMLGKCAAQLGGDYSGDTTYLAHFSPSANQVAAATTSTWMGESYGGRARKYSKTDARHRVRLDPRRVHELVNNPTLCEQSRRDGLPLIALDADGACVWVKSHGKQITEVSGWIIGDEFCCYHSTVSREVAVAGHAKKTASLAADRARVAAVLARLAEDARAYKASPAGKAERRACLVARLCGGITATIADARELGYCSPGIEAFQREHGIGDAASLPALIKSGNPAAVRLALAIARKTNKAA